MPLLDGRTILVTGILTRRSIAFAVAARALAEGATVVATGFGRGLSTTERALAALAAPVRLVELDVTSADQLASLVDRLGVDHLDGLVHAVAGAAPSALDGGISATLPAAACRTLETSAISLATVTGALLPLLAASQAGGGASVVTLTFAADRVWPGYGWMGVAKGTLESIVRSLAVELGPHGVRVNAVDAGPLRTPSARAIPGVRAAFDAWGEVAPLGWDVDDPSVVADAVVTLLSPLLAKTTGSTLVVDGGAHVVGH